MSPLLLVKVSPKIAQINIFQMTDLRAIIIWSHSIIVLYFNHILCAVMIRSFHPLQFISRIDSSDQYSQGHKSLGWWWRMRGSVWMLIVASDVSGSTDAALSFTAKLWRHVKIYRKTPESFFSRPPNKRRLITFVSLTTFTRVLFSVSKAACWLNSEVHRAQ